MAKKTVRTSQTTTALLPGVYQTAVNIHNPQRKQSLDVERVFERTL